MRLRFLPCALLAAGTVAAAPTTTSLAAPHPFELIAADSTSGEVVKRNIGGVRLCTGANWTGSCWYGVYPLNICIDLNDYAGHVLSFRPDEDTECFLMQGRCNANADYADLQYNSTGIGNLSVYSWIVQVQSYTCFKPLPL